MGALEDVGIKKQAFFGSLVELIGDRMENSSTPNIEFLNLSVGFETGNSGGKEMADAWKASVLSPESSFKANFIDSGFAPIFNLIDAIPPINILKSLPIPIIDPTAALLPLTNAIAEVLASIGIPNPNEFFLTKIGKFLEKQDELLRALNKFKSSTASVVQRGVNRLAAIINEIEPELEIETLKTRIAEKIDDIKDVLNIPDISLPEPPYFQVPDITDVVSFALSFFNFPIPDIPNITIDDIIALYFDFELEIPPIGVFFAEIAKSIIEMLVELASGIPPFLTVAIDKIIELFPLNFSLSGILKAISESVIGYLFEKLAASEKISNLIQHGSGIVYVLNGLVLSLVSSLIVSIVGVLFGKGLIMKSSAIGLGLLK